jgi:hypothetical protein
VYRMLCEYLYRKVEPRSCWYSIAGNFRRNRLVSHLFLLGILSAHWIAI